MLWWSIHGRHSTVGGRFCHRSHAVKNCRPVRIIALSCMDCSFMSCNLVLRFYVLHYQRQRPLPVYQLHFAFAVLLSININLFLTSVYIFKYFTIIMMVRASSIQRSAIYWENGQSWLWDCTFIKCFNTRFSTVVEFNKDRNIL